MGEAHALSLALFLRPAGRQERLRDAARLWDATVRDLVEAVSDWGGISRELAAIETARRDLRASVEVLVGVVG